MWENLPKYVACDAHAFLWFKYKQIELVNKAWRHLVQLWTCALNVWVENKKCYIAKKKNDMKCSWAKKKYGTQASWFL